MKILHLGYGFDPLRGGGVIAYAEDLMRVQVAAGHEVSYFFPGRHTVAPRNRLTHWSRDGVEMRELRSTTLLWGATGTIAPEDDLAHAPTEAAFEEVLAELHPDVVHIQEFAGLPSSVIDIAHDRGTPVIATLQDYMPLCPVLKLYDVDGRRCLRRHPAPQCRRCCADAPVTPRWMVEETVRYEFRERLPDRWARIAQGAFNRAAAAEWRVQRRLRKLNPAAADPVPPPAASYQARRDVNVERLGRLDALIVQSRRVAEIYAHLGVPADLVQVMQFTLRHVEHIAPKAIETPSPRVRFVTLNGCSSVEKGSEVVIGALEELARAGVGDRIELTVLGVVPHDARERLARFPNVRLAGPYEPERLDALLDDFHVGIVPSIWEESYAYVGVELLAKGIPVIGNARGGIVDYTRDRETGWVNREASAAGLAAIMAGIVARPEQVSQLNAAIRSSRDRIIKPFAQHVGEIEAVYRQVTGSRQKVAL